MTYVIHDYALGGTYAPRCADITGLNAASSITDMYVDVEAIHAFLSSSFPATKRNTSVSYRSDDGTMDEYALLVAALRNAGPEVIAAFAERKMSLRGVRPGLNVYDEERGRTRAGGIAAYVYTEHHPSDHRIFAKHIASGDMDHDAFFKGFANRWFDSQGFTPQTLAIMATLVMDSGSQQACHLGQGVLRRFREAGCTFALWEQACLDLAPQWIARSPKDIEMLTLTTGDIVVYFDPEAPELKQTYMQKLRQYAKVLEVELEQEELEWAEESEADLIIEMRSAEAHDFRVPANHWYTSSQPANE